MDVKALVTGFVSGSLATLAIVSYLDQNSSAVDSSQARSSDSASPPSLAVTADTQLNYTPPAGRTPEGGPVQSDTTIEPDPALPRPDDFKDHVEPFQVMDVDTPAISIAVTDGHRKLLGSSSKPDKNSGSAADVHAALETEPRDYDWSFFMEQSIQQFLGGHIQIAYFDVVGIECRTTICEIQAYGVDESAVPRWGLIMHDLRGQPWSDFGQTGSSSRTIDGRQVIITHLHRLSDPN